MPSRSTALRWVTMTPASGSVSGNGSVTPPCWRRQTLGLDSPRLNWPAISVSAYRPSSYPPLRCPQCRVASLVPTWRSHGSVMSATGRAATPCSCQARLRACRGRDNACRVGLAPRQRATLESRDNVPPVRRDLPECGVVGDDASAPPQLVRDDLLRRAGLRRERRERSFTEIRRGGLCDHRNYRSIVRQSP